MKYLSSYIFKLKKRLRDLSNIIRNEHENNYKYVIDFSFQHICSC